MSEVGGGVTAGLLRPDAGHQRQPVSDSGRCPRRRLQGQALTLLESHAVRDLLDTKAGALQSWSDGARRPVTGR